jgi:hypothetical protein
MVQGMAAAAQSAVSTALDFTFGSVLRAILEANASLALWLQWLVLQVLAVTRLATSTGADCDSFGADYGFLRLGASFAGGQVTFFRSATTQAAQVMVGTVVKTKDGTQSYAVNLDATNAAYQADPTGATSGWYNIGVGVANVTCSVTAVAAGSAGNILSGTVGLIVGAIPYVDSVSNASAFAGGNNAESDVAYKARFMLFLASLSRATPVAVQAAIASVATNLTYAIRENYSNAGVYQPGNFSVTVDDGSGATPGATLALVSAAVDAVRPIGSSFSVQAATVLRANISMSITCPTAQLKALATAVVADAIASYIASLPVGGALSYTRLLQVAYNASANVTDITGALLNGGSSDIGGQFNIIVRAGTIVVS